jgi:hypothetical protein
MKGFAQQFSRSSLSSVHLVQVVPPARDAAGELQLRSFRDRDRQRAWCEPRLPVREVSSLVQEGWVAVSTDRLGAENGRRGGRMSRQRKTAAVMRLLRGEDLETVSRSLGVTAATPKLKLTHLRGVAAGLGGLRFCGDLLHDPRRRNPLCSHQRRVCVSVWHFGLTRPKPPKTRALNSPGTTSRGPRAVSRPVLWTQACC